MADLDKEYVRGFKDGLKSKIGEELQPMIAQVLEGVSEAIKGLIPRMIDIMEIKANLDANDWIPCSERLPEENKVVLVSTTMGYVDFAVLRWGKWFPDGYNGVAFPPNRITAWMPKPDAYEPPKEGDNDA
jgi:hypothetical protein